MVEHTDRKLISNKNPPPVGQGKGKGIYFTSWMMGRIMGRRLVRS